MDWVIDSRERLVVVRADGAVSRANIEALLVAVAGAGAMGYRKLIDATAGEFSLSVEDIWAIGAMARSYHKGKVGAAAIVLPRPSGISSTAAQLVARLIGMLATADRPLRVFKSMTSARRWLNAAPRLDP